MTNFINRQLSTNYNKKRIRRLMKILGIRSVIRRVRQSCTKVGERFYEANILNRDFTATAPNQKWCTDVTYLQYGIGATPIIHSDRGSQYTSKEYRYITQQAGLTLSMSRVGKCIDNAPIESFFGHFKTESYHLKKYKTYDELVTDVEAYIKFYNTQRYQAKLNNLTPFEFRNQAA